jgi:beta-glucosidase
MSRKLQVLGPPDRQLIVCVNSNFPTAYADQFKDVADMARRDEANESREGLLRKSLEEAYRSSSDSRDSLDGEDFLEADALQGRPQTPVQAYQTSTSLSRLRSQFNRRSKCLIIFLVVCIIFWSILAAGGYWLYTIPPKDGLSPPWYPTPAGGTVSSWAESYVKAAKLVEQMSLPEKVNVTTGTGKPQNLLPPGPLVIADER